MVDQTEEVRQWLRQNSLRSLFFFAKTILGFVDMTPELHLSVCTFLQRPERQKLIELPRRHLKSTICTIAYPVWRIIHNPNIRILLMSATSTNASKFLRDIMAIFEYNDAFRWLFPEIIPDFKKVKWTETAIEVNRSLHFPEATIEAIGVGGTAVSRHYNLQIKDDLVNEDHLIDPEQMKKVIESHRRSVDLGIDPKKDEEIIVGNRWAFDDVISYVKENQPYFVNYSRAAIEDGKPIWPERFDQESLDKILELQGPKIFSCQYMNNPVHEDPRSFDQSWLRHYNMLPPGVPFKFFTAVDPAIAQKRGDYSAIVTIGVDPDWNIYVVDARRDRWGVDELIDNMFEVYAAWKPIGFGLETVMFQRALLWPIREAMRRTGIHFRITELKPSSKMTKEVRIASLHEYFSNGSIFLRTGQRDLEREIKEFPASSHDDLIDALAYSVQMARPAQRENTIDNNPFMVDNIIRELEGKVARGKNRLWSFHDQYPTTEKVGMN